MPYTYLYIISLTILIGAALLILSSFKLVEMFESSASTDEDTVNAYITIVSESLCPALLFMMKDAMEDASSGGDDDSGDTSSIRNSKDEAQATLSQQSKIQSQPQTGTEEENKKKFFILIPQEIKYPMKFLIL